MRKALINRDEVRSTVLTLQLTPSEKKEIQDASAKMGLTMSSFARLKLLESIRGK